MGSVKGPSLARAAATRLRRYLLLAVAPDNWKVDPNSCRSPRIGRP
jgi:hypothetical protein